MKKKLSLPEKFGQMLLIGLDVYDIDEEIINLIKEFKVGGVVLYKKNYTSIDKMVAVIKRLKEANKDNKIPLFIAVDQENGRVNRLPKDIERIVSPLKQAGTKNLKLVALVNKLTSLILKEVGVNMNLAPVLDIIRSDKNKVIGDRSYGSSKEEVLKYGFLAMRGLQKNKIVSVVKHFPGHGLTVKDSHIGIPKIDNLNTLEKEDLWVYQEIIKQGSDAVLVGHLKVKGYGMKPASINKNIIDDYLIKKCNFDGLIITDDLRMNSLKYLWGIKRSICLSIEAGINMVMVKYKKNDYKIYRELLKKVQNYEIDVEKIEKSAQKIVEMKEKYQISDNFADFSLKIEEINAKIRDVNKLIEECYENRGNI